MSDLRALFDGFGARLAPSAFTLSIHRRQLDRLRPAGLADSREMQPGRRRVGHADPVDVDGVKGGGQRGPGLGRGQKQEV